MMKYVHLLEKFLSHVRKVAEHNADVVFSDNDVDGGVCTEEAEDKAEDGTEESLISENGETNEYVQ